MSNNVSFMATIMCEAATRATRELPNEPIGNRSIYAWGTMIGKLLQFGATWQQVKPAIFEVSGNGVGEGMSINELVTAIGKSMLEVIQTTPSTMLGSTDQEELLEDVACRMVLEGVKHGLVIVDRKRYDKLVSENAALRDSVALFPKA